MGRKPPKNPDPPTTPDDAPEGDNKGGTVRKPRGGKKAANPARLAQAVDALLLIKEAGVDPAKLRESYANTIKVFPVDEVNAALTQKGLDLAEFQPPAGEGAAPSSNMVTENTVTTGSVVPVTGSDGSLPPVTGNAPTAPTPEQAAALQALGLKGGNPPQQTAAPQAAAGGGGGPLNPPKNPNRPLTIQNMVDMLGMGALDYTKPFDVPPTLIESRTVDPAAVAGQPTVQTRTAEFKPKPPTQPFQFPAGIDFSSDDGRVQLVDVDYGQARSTVADPLTPVQWYARQNAGAQPSPQQLSGPKEPDPPNDDIPLNRDKGFVGMYRDRKNYLNSPAFWAAGLGGMASGGLAIHGLVNMLRGQLAANPPQPQGEDPDEALLKSTNTVGGFR